MTEYIYRYQLTLTDDSRSSPLVQVNAFGRTIWAEALYPYGMTARAPVGSIGLGIPVGDDPENNAALCVSGAERPANLKEGEAAFGNFLAGTYMKFTSTSVEFYVNHNLVFSCDATQFATSASISTEGEIEAAQDISSQGTITALTDVQAGPEGAVVSLTTHVHTSAAPGNPTSPPIPIP